MSWVIANWTAIHIMWRSTNAQTRTIIQNYMLISYSTNLEKDDDCVYEEKVEKVGIWAQNNQGRKEKKRNEDIWTLMGMWAHQLWGLEHKFDHKQTMIPIYPEPFLPFIAERKYVPKICSYQENHNKNSKSHEVCSDMRILWFCVQGRSQKN